MRFLLIFCASFQRIFFDIFTFLNQDIVKAFENLTQVAFNMTRTALSNAIRDIAARPDVQTKILDEASVKRDNVFSFLMKSLD